MPIPALAMMMAAGASAISYTDNFNRADNSSATIDGNWTVDTQYAVISNQLGFAASTTSPVYASFVPALPTNMFAEIDIVSGNTGSKVIAIMLRANTNNAAPSSWYMFRWFGSTGNWEIHRSTTLLASAATPDPSAPWRMRFEAETVSGGDVELRGYEWNGSSWSLRVSDTDPSGSALSGIYSGLRSIASTSMFADNWVCGAL